MPEQYFKNKKFIYLAAGFGVVIAGILLRELVFKPKELPLPEITIVAPQVQIDFNLLKNLDLKNLTSVEEIVLPVGNFRENPFEPY